MRTDDMLDGLSKGLLIVAMICLLTAIAVL